MSTRPPASAKAPTIGVVFNPRSHRNRKVVDAVQALPGVIVASPGKRGELRGVLAGFAERGVDCIAISGGDGTVRDVITAGMPVFGSRWPLLAVVPSGKTNALAVDLGAPKGWAVSDVIEALEEGGRRVRRPLRVRAEDGSELYGFVLGAGLFTVAISAGQDAHRLGAFDSLAVGATTGWAILQTLLGSYRNVFRRGAAMRIRTGEELVELPRVGRGDPARRAVVLAASLERFPMGMSPFPPGDGVRMFVIDNPRRRLFAAGPLIAYGWDSPWLARMGFHRFAASRVGLEIDDAFILDGEAFAGGRYEITLGPPLTFVVP